MKLLPLVLLLAATAASAQSHYRSGYITKSGTYVAPSYATNPNATKLDNYSTKGNVNPYTGRAGTVDPYSSALGGARRSALDNGSLGRSTLDAPRTRRSLLDD